MTDAQHVLLHAAALTALLTSTSCGERCDEYLDRPVPQAYTVAYSSTDPVLEGATVSVTEDTLTIEYEDDGTTVTVTYAIGEHF